MSREERLMAKGAMVEKKRRIRELETELAGLRVVIRDCVSPFKELDDIDADLLCLSSERMKACKAELQTAKSDLRRLEDEWGD